MFGNFHLRMAYDSERNRYMENNPPAFKTGSTSCNRCALCCHTRPPRLTQDELHRLALKFNMTDREFFREHCVIDNPGGSDWAPVLIRADQKHLAGCVLPSDETYSFSSPCHQLATVDGVHSCQLEDAKPSECAEHKCWDDDSGDISKRYNWTREELIAIGWSGDEYESDDN
jgi:hypothetical protein